jgi:hypothetical protein
MRYRIWCEDLDYARLEDRKLLSALRDRNVSLLVSVKPHQLSTVSLMVRTCRRAGVSVGLWPMLENRAGRWVNNRTMGSFVEFARALLQVLDEPPQVLVVDLEPPLEQVRRLTAGRFWSLAHNATVSASPEGLLAILEELKRRGIASMAAVLPMVVADQRGALGIWSQGWQRVLATRVDGLPFDHVCVMAYTSMIEGYSRGFLRRDDCRAL